MQSNPIRIIIADDKKDICEILSKSLSSNPMFEICDIVHSGKDAIEKIHLHTPDIVLLDLMMPDIDGFGVLYSIKKAGLNNKTKIIILSGTAQESFIKSAFDLGASYFIMKPFDLGHLTKIILKVNSSSSIITNNLNNSRNNSSNNTTSNTCTSSPQKEIRKRIMEIGIPTNIVGYEYIVFAIDFITNRSCVGGLSKNIYKPIAHTYNTSIDCVETAIRNAIKKASDTCNDAFKSYFYDIICAHKYPSNSKFLTKMSEIIRLTN